MKAINKAIKAAGGVSALAKLVKANSPQVVSNWRLRGVIPPEWVIPVELATEGKITRHELRPDLYPLERAA